MNLSEQLKADAAALRAEAAAKIAQAETLEQHAGSAIGVLLSREFAEVKADLQAIPAELHAWIIAHE